MKKLKIAAIVLGSLLLLMFLLPFAFQGKIADIVKNEGNKLLNAQFDFKKLNISLFKNFPQASLTLEDFWLKGIHEFNNDTLIEAGELTATVNLLSLFGNSGYDISEIAIKNTKVHAIVLPNGKVNWDIMKNDSSVHENTETDEPPISPFKIMLKHFIIEQMEVVFDDQQAKMYAQMQNFDAQCSGDLSSDHTMLNIEAETKSLTYKMNGIPLLSNANIATKMDVDADLTNMKFTLKENEFRLNAIKTGIDGWISLGDPAIDMDIKLNTNDVGFKEILSLIPAIYTTEFSDLKTEGTATLSASAKGILQGDTVPSFKIDMQVKDAMFKYPSLPAGVDQIQVHAKVENPGGDIDLTTIQIQPFSFRMAGNPFQVTAHIATPISDPNFTAEAKGLLNLGMLKDVYPMKETNLNGTVNANVQLSGRMSFIEKEQYDQVKASGTISLSDMNLRMQEMPDVEIQKSIFTFTPQYLQLSETTVNLGKNDITAECRFENYIAYALKGKTLKGNLNIHSKHLNLNDFMSAATDSTVVTDATVSDTTTVQQIIPVPRNLDFQMEANLKEVVFDQMKFNNINGNLTIKDGKVDMKNLSMNTMGGKVTVNGYYSTTNPKKPVIEGGFKLNEIVFSEAYKELNMIQKMAPIFENLKGNFSGSIHMTSELDHTMSPILNTMKGEGSLSVKDLSLSGVKSIDQIADAIKQPSLKDMKVKDMNVDFAIKDGRISTDPFDIKMGDYTLNLSGSTGLDQSIDYTGKILLPASSKFNKISSVDLKIEGTFSSPKINVDMASMASQALENVASQALDKLGEKLGIDSTATQNKDSLKQQAVKKAFDILKKIK